MYIVPENRTLWEVVDEGNKGDGLSEKGGTRSQDLTGQHWAFILIFRYQVHNHLGSIITKPALLGSKVANGGHVRWAHALETW